LWWVQRQAQQSRYQQQGQELRQQHQQRTLWMLRWVTAAAALGV
jgi:hypothetical protein